MTPECKWFFLSADKTWVYSPFASYAKAVIVVELPVVGRRDWRLEFYCDDGTGDFKYSELDCEVDGNLSAEEVQALALLIRAGVSHA